MVDNWCTIESDPGVFTELIKKIGVKNVMVEEIYTLEDQDLMDSLKPIHGLIFLFKWKKDPVKRETLQVYDEDLFFANQTIKNACATQAILSVLINCPQVDIGPELENFKNFTKSFDSKTRGQVLSNSEVIREVHNSFARPEPFSILKSKKPKKGGAAFHFVGYVPFKGKLYELDGLQEGPILIGDIEGRDWLEMAKNEITARTLGYGEEIRFNLLAICDNKHDQAIEENRKLTAISAHLFKKLRGLGEKIDTEAHPEVEELISKADSYICDEKDIPGTVEEVNKKLKTVNDQIKVNGFTIKYESEKFKKYDAENKRRRHNYIPFILGLLRLTAQKGTLGKVFEEAKERREAREKLKETKTAK